MDIEKTTDPGIIRLKLKQEIQTLRDARREDRMEFYAESQRAATAYNDLAAKHNQMVVTAGKAIDLAAVLAACLGGVSAFALLLAIAAWFEGTVPLRALVLSACIGLGTAGVIHTLISDALWREKAE